MFVSIGSNALYFLGACMFDPRLLSIVTAFLIVGSGNSANAAYTLIQLQEVDRLIQSKDCGALLGYLGQNTELLEGNDPLAQELRNFTLGVQGGLIQCLSVPPELAGSNNANVTSAY